MRRNYPYKHILSWCWCCLDWRQHMYPIASDPETADLSKSSIQHSTRANFNTMPSKNAYLLNHFTKPLSASVQYWAETTKFSLKVLIEFHHPNGSLLTTNSSKSVSKACRKKWCSNPTTIFRMVVLYDCYFWRTQKVYCLKECSTVIRKTLAQPTICFSQTNLLKDDFLPHCDNIDLRQARTATSNRQKTTRCCNVSCAIMSKTKTWHRTFSRM